MNARMRTIAASCVVAGVLWSTASVVAQPARLPAGFEVTAENFDAWCAAIRPSASDAAFRSIPWRLDLGNALETALVEQRPVLLWLMDGHPLGPT